MVKGEPRHTERRTQAERSATTRAALLNAARRLFAINGYAATAREDIVAKAGLTRGALQHHFGDKETLFLAVYEAEEQAIVERVAAKAMRAGDDAVEQLRAGCHAYLDAVLDPETQRICAIDGPAVLSVPVRQEITERYALGLVRQALRHGMAAGQIDDAPVDAFAQVLLAGVMAAAQYVVHADKPRQARVEAGQTIDLILDRLRHN